MYADRREAGRTLAECLQTAVDDGPVTVLALPRGGVPVAAEVARRLGVPLDLCYVRKIGAPSQPELAIGAVADGVEPRVVLNQRLIAELGVSDSYVAETTQRKLADIERQRALYQPGRPPPMLAGRTVILVDDGLATGTTARAALRAVRAAGARRAILAVPVAPADTLASLEADADAIVCPRVPEPFFAVGEQYRRFPQVSDQDVAAVLQAAAGPDGAHSGGGGMSGNDAA